MMFEDRSLPIGGGTKTAFPIVWGIGRRFRQWAVEPGPTRLGADSVRPAVFSVVRKVSGYL
jgi:hypothetical protein